MVSHNSESSIKKSLTSMISQDYNFLEFIIIDDNSTDSTVAIIKKVIRNKKNIYLHINKKNEGIGFNRYLGKKLSKGKFLVFFDDDDTFAKDRVRIQINEILKLQSIYNTKKVLNYAKQKLIYSKSYKKTFDGIGNIKPITNREAIFKNTLYPYKIDINYGSGVPCSSLALPNHNDINFDAILRKAEDIDFALNASIKNYIFSTTKKILVYRNMNKKFTFNEWYESYFYIYNKYAYLIPAKELKFQVKWIKLKTFYEKNKLVLILNIIFLFIKFPIKLSKKIINFGFQRIIHDYKKR
jgi:glycosyltransferase involved in cell wall biosynthesis